jgi:hypothetical protein
MEAMRAERVQLETLVQRAEQALSEAGYSPSAEARRRIGDTLLGAAADRHHADALAHGRLTEELQAPGFDALTGSGRLRLVQGGAGRRDDAQRRPPDDERARHADTRARDAQTRAPDAKTRLREAKAREREAKARERAEKAEQRRQEAEARRRAAAERAAQVAALEREAAEARGRLAAVQRRLKEARRGKGAPTR